MTIHHVIAISADVGNPMACGALLLIPAHQLTGEQVEPISPRSKTLWVVVLR